MASTILEQILENVSRGARLPRPTELASPERRSNENATPTPKPTPTQGADDLMRTVIEEMDERLARMVEQVLTHPALSATARSPRGTGPSANSEDAAAPPAILGGTEPIDPLRAHRAAAPFGRADHEPAILSPPGARTPTTANPPTSPFPGAGPIETPVTEVTAPRAVNAPVNTVAPAMASEANPPTSPPASSFEIDLEPEQVGNTPTEAPPVAPANAEVSSGATPQPTSDEEETLDTEAFDAAALAAVSESAHFAHDEEATPITGMGGATVDDSNTALVTPADDDPVNDDFAADDTAADDTAAKDTAAEDSSTAEPVAHPTETESSNTETPETEPAGDVSLESSETTVTEESDASTAIEPGNALDEAATDPTTNELGSGNGGAQEEPTDLAIEAAEDLVSAIVDGSGATDDAEVDPSASVGSASSAGANVGERLLDLVGAMQASESGSSPVVPAGDDDGVIAQVEAIVEEIARTCGPTPAATSTADTSEDAPIHPALEEIRNLLIPLQQLPALLERQGSPQAEILSQVRSLANEVRELARAPRIVASDGEKVSALPAEDPAAKERRRVAIDDIQGMIQSLS